MKNYKYIGLFLLSLGIISCDVNNELDVIPEEVVPVVELNTNGLDFSSYVAVGASFTAGKLVTYIGTGRSSMSCCSSSGSLATGIGSQLC